MNERVFNITKELRYELLKIIPDEGSKETKPEQILLNAIIHYENKRRK